MERFLRRYADFMAGAAERHREECESQFMLPIPGVIRSIGVEVISHTCHAGQTRASIALMHAFHKELHTPRQRKDHH
jgi:hypothetical protein